MSGDRPGEHATRDAGHSIRAPRALLSVSDKDGLVAFAVALRAMGWKLISTGGTARHLVEAGLDVTEVSDVTGHPEMMDGRVKTLHPAVHAGLLARLDHPADVDALRATGYEPIDLVAVNLYPFVRTAARDPNESDLLEQIDIGGPTLLRAAAKNHRHVLVVCEPLHYGEVLAALQDAQAVDGPIPQDLRRSLALTAFEHTAAYDAAIAGTLHARWRGPPQTAVPDDTSSLPDHVLVSARRKGVLRYGENPHQAAALYQEDAAELRAHPSLIAARQLHGVELSTNNWLDLDSALRLARAYQRDDWSDTPHCCVVVKHNNPCGVALAATQQQAWADALASDPQSAFGCVVAFNSVVNEATAAAIADHFLECIIAPGYEPGALTILQAKRRRRILTLEDPVDPSGWLPPAEQQHRLRDIEGGCLLQTDPVPPVDWSSLIMPTRTRPTPEQLTSMRFGVHVCQRVASNAIVFVQGTRTVGIGPGQTSRVEAVTIAAHRAGDRASGAVMISDAFFPFRDGLDAAAAAGIAAVIHPGGSVRDQEVVDAADEHGIAMACSGVRLFRH